MTSRPSEATARGTTYAAAPNRVRPPERPNPIAAVIDGGAIKRASPAGPQREQSTAPKRALAAQHTESSSSARSGTSKVAERSQSDTREIRDYEARQRHRRRMRLEGIETHFTNGGIIAGTLLGVGGFLFGREQGYSVSSSLIYVFSWGILGGVFAALLGMFILGGGPVVAILTLAATATAVFFTLSRYIGLSESWSIIGASIALFGLVLLFIFIPWFRRTINR